MATTTVPAALRDRGVQVGLLTIALVAGLDAVARVPLTGGYAIGAVATATSSSPRRTAVVGMVAVAAAALSSVADDSQGRRELIARIFICVVLAALGVASASIRTSREERLRRMTYIADAAQQAILRDLPERLPPVRLAARYVSATEDAIAGGDLYDVAVGPHGPRILVGDVSGHGIGAIHTAATVLRAFGRAAVEEADLGQVARRVDDVLAHVVDDDEFVTAVLVDVGVGTLTIASCGHPPPLLLGAGGASFLEPDERSRPLGLEACPRPTTHTWGPGDRLLLYTDGLVESRDGRGEFFRLEEHVEALRADSLPDALDRLLTSVQAFSGRPRDDVALVLLEHE